MSLAPDLEWTDLAIRGWGVYQRRGGYRFSIDAVLLAHFPALNPGLIVCDACSGSGVVAHLMTARQEGMQTLGLELQPQMAAAACASRDRNGISPQTLDFACRDLRTCGPDYAGRFDLVTANPPYYKPGAGALSPDPETALARHEQALDLDGLCAFAARALKRRGRLALIHRAGRLDDVLAACTSHRLKPARLAPVYAREGQQAQLILVEAILDGRNEMTIEEPFYIYDKAGRYRPTVAAWYEE